MVNLILGTATFGTGYGIANNGIRLENNAVAEIIKTAQSSGIVEFDTAPAYGQAEVLLGTYLDQGFLPKISSKIGKEDAKSVKLMIASVEETLRRTKVDKLANLYLHDPEALSGIGASEAIAGLTELIGLELVEHVGVSVYSLQSLLEAKGLFPELSVFQVPENICDRRMLHSKELMDLANEGDSFIVRSIFLQGLLLMPSNEIPSELEQAKSAVSKIRTFLDSNPISPLDLCLGYGRAIPWASGLVIGAATASQLRQIIESKSILPIGWDSDIPTLPKEILDPRQWQK